MLKHLFRCFRSVFLCYNEFFCFHSYSKLLLSLRGQKKVVVFQELGFIEKYHIDKAKLARFILLVSKGYRDVPYHNWSHAFAVSHFSYLLLRTKSVQEKLTDIERFALLVGSLCHDIDHRGTSNKFQMDLVSCLFFIVRLSDACYNWFHCSE